MEGKDTVCIGNRPRENESVRSPNNGGNRGSVSHSKAIDTILDRITLNAKATDIFISFLAIPRVYRIAVKTVNLI